ncbi:MAG: haloalkane dehalogenase [Chloroflexota bacterium]
MTQSTISPVFPFESKYQDVHGSRMHYVEVGDPDADPILFLHGNPTSVYLWRNIMPYLAEQGRCIAVDLIGMGKSDKPDLPYRFHDHVKYLEGFIEALALKNITLVIHDWGSGLGFNYWARHQGNVKGIAFMESILAAEGPRPLQFRMLFAVMRTPGLGWLMISVFNAFINQLLQGAIVRQLSPQEMAHYRAPYPTIASRKPVRQWPLEVPIDGAPADVSREVEAYTKALQESDVPKLLLYAQPGFLITEQNRPFILNNFPNLTAVDIGKGLHYVQEDNPHGTGEAISAWYSTLS